MTQLTSLFGDNLKNRERILVDVLLPTYLDVALTYIVPQDLEASIVIGGRAIVPLGKSKFCAGVIVKKYSKQVTKALKEILEIIDESAVLDVNTQLDFFNWVSKYYLCKIGEVLSLALPGSLKMFSDTTVQIHSDFDGDCSEISLEEQEILKLIAEEEVVSIKKLKKQYTSKKFHPTLQKLYEKKIIYLEEEIRNSYAPKVVKKISLVAHHKDKVNELIRDLERYPKQQEIVLAYLVEIKKSEKKEDSFIEKKLLQREDLSVSSLKTLIKNKILEEKFFTVPRFILEEKELKHAPALSEIQEECYNNIIKNLKQKDVVLLHGATGSGKTEILIKLIFEVLKKDHQVLYLLPEIAITTQLVNRISSFFGTKVGIYHSKFSSQERAETWQNVISNKVKVILGVRSSIFLPFKNLKLVIIDEEHDFSYKNSLNHPRYHGRDGALVLAKKHNAKVILSSATPSIESYYNAKVGNFGISTITKRYGEAKFPEVNLVNILFAKKSKKVKDEFSEELLSSMEKSLKHHEQSIIFQNKLGYAIYISCMGCANVPMCINCSVSLTYHQSRDYLKCHFCRYTVSFNPKCGICNSVNVKNIGFGTEKLQESLENILPDAEIARMDGETVSTKRKMEKLIDDIENSNIDIIIGTQMIVKGFDFPKVTTIGVTQADHLLFMQDFRANERAFSTLYQLCGRGGRGDRPARVFIQTSRTNHKTLQAIKNDDYESMYDQEILERKKYSYPPFSRLVKISFLHKNYDYVKKASEIFFNEISTKISFIKVLPPTAPVIARIRMFFIFEIWIKIPTSDKKNLPAMCKNHLSKIMDTLKLDKNFRSCRVIVDIDP